MQKKAARPSHLYRLTVELYRCQVYIAIAETLQEAINRLPEEFTKEQDSVDDAAGMFLSDGIGGFAICFSYPHLDINTITHELFHLGHDILAHANVKYDIDNDEPGALLIGWLMEKTIAKLRQWKVNI
jgi:hypothetical protein